MKYFSVLILFTLFSSPARAGESWIPLYLSKVEKVEYVKKPFKRSDGVVIHDAIAVFRVTGEFSNVHDNLEAVKDETAIEFVSDKFSRVVHLIARTGLHTDLGLPDRKFTLDVPVNPFVNRVYLENTPSKEDFSLQMEGKISQDRPYQFDYTRIEYNSTKKEVEITPVRSPK